MKRVSQFVLLIMVFAIPQNLQAQIIDLPLKEILQVENIRLEGTNGNTDKHEFSLPIPRRWSINTAILTFGYTNSTALIKNRSRLIFSLNGNPLAQVPLDPQTPQGQVSVSIPVKLLTPGYHPFRFEVAQHSAQGNCEDPSAPELWTWVELSEAKISFDVTLNPVPERLSAIADFLFDPRNPAVPPVNLIFPKITEAAMKPVALCASGVALRYDYRSVPFVSIDGFRSGMDTILVGPEAFIKSRLAQLDLLDADWSANGPLLAIHPLPLKKKMVSGQPKILTDPDHCLVVVTGKDWDDVLTAAKAFSLVSLPLPDSPWALVNDLIIPGIDPYTLKNGLTQNKAYSLSNLGFSTTTFKGTHPVPQGFGFRLPSDSHLLPNSQATLSLNMAYGANMRTDSVMNILLNDKFVAAIPCSDESGGNYSHYKIRLLLSSMKPGYNKLTFSPVLTPLITDKCTMIQTGNLRLTLFDDSTFSLPTIDQWIEMPQLKAFMTDGFPFGRFPDMRDTTIVVPDQTRQSFLTALNLVALAAQKTGFPPLEASFRLTPPETSDKDILIVSTADTIPDAYSTKAPLDLSSSGTLRYPHLTRPRGYDPGQDGGFWSKLLPHKGARVVDVSLQDAQFVVTRFDPFLMVKRAALMQFQSPFKNNRTVMVLTAHTLDDMAAAGTALWDRGLQSSSSGDTLLIDLSDPAYKTTALKLGPSYYLGNVGSTPFIAYYTNTYPKQFILLLLGLSLATALLIYIFLKRRSRRRIVDE
ncbi:MAG: cellulose biosynthesis cyclic di-GMP-binding regulatory protein BcsB [Desulfobacterium sp.]|nr:cellulose biosynthesis cyclic di-GMP-binding regulatory protein BcsB [Desulfobacterium sp.]